MKSKLILISSPNIEESHCSGLSSSIQLLLLPSAGTALQPSHNECHNSPMLKPLAAKIPDTRDNTPGSFCTKQLKVCLHPVQPNKSTQSAAHRNLSGMEVESSPLVRLSARWWRIVQDVVDRFLGGYRSGVGEDGEGGWAAFRELVCLVMWALYHIADVTKFQFFGSAETSTIGMYPRSWFNDRDLQSRALVLSSIGLGGLLSP